MHLATATILLFVFILLYSIIIELFTVLFRLTGLTRDKARMQVISMLTNSGFTTAESEIIMSSKQRRSLAQATMLFGYSFTVLIVSLIVNMFLSLSQSELTLITPVIFSTAATVIAIFCILRLPTIHHFFDHTIERIGNRIMYGKTAKSVVLLDIYGPKAMAEILIQTVPSFLLDTPLAESGLRETYDIHVLYIKHDRDNFKDTSGKTILREKDVAVVFGNYKNIRKVFEGHKQKNG